MIFRVVVSGVPTPTLTWKSGEKELFSNYSNTVGNDGTLTFPNTEIDQSGVYVLEARNVDQSIPVSVSGQFGFVSYKDSVYMFPLCEL